MAKKITITGSNKLSEISDDWGGKNESGSSQTKYGVTIPAGAEWGMNRGEVERFIKAQFGTKFGDFRTTDPDANNFVHILCFATTEDAEAYDEDPTEGMALVVKDLTIPISTASVDSYIATLITSRSTSTQYLVKDGDSFIVPLRFNATHVIAATSSQELMSGNGTLVIRRSVNGTTWTQVKTMTIAASSSTSGYPVEVDLKGCLLDGTANYISLHAVFGYTDNEGVSKTMSSTPLILNVNSVTLSLEMDTSWHEPVVDPSSLQLAYTVRGTVARTLHLKVTGSAGTYETTQSLTSAQTNASFSLSENVSYGLLTHGIKTCEAWLTAGNSTIGELESAHLVTRVMVVRKNAGAQVYMQPRLLISEMKEIVENFVQTKLLSYAIYSPIVNSNGDIVNMGASIPTTFILTNSAQNILTESQNIYASLLVNPSPGMKYDLNMTVEIEQEGSELASYLHATREDGGTTKDFLLESIGEGYLYLPVDNTSGFQPTAGSTFLMNPKQRNNDEANPKTILNAKSNNAVVSSTWENFRLGLEDGYIKDDVGESCLRVPAGRRLTIGYNPLGLLYRSPNSSLNIELDVCIRNVTNEDDPIVKLAEQVSGVWRGLRMLPMTGYMTTESWNADEESDFRWQEDVRTHIAINIVNAVRPNAHGDALTTAEKASQAQGSFSLVRVFINGIINREFVYNPGTTEFCTGANSNGGMVFGQNGADIDIYGIRVWEGTALTPEQVLQDYISTLPNSDEKRRLKAENAIIDPNTGLIGLDYITGEGAVTGIKKNIMIWHGNEPYHENAHKGETGWLEMWRFDSQGNYLPELSGTICQATKSIPQKAQGTTAKTYYYHNIQVKIQDAEGTITIDPSDLHSSITAEWDASYEWLDDNNQATGETGAWMIKGGYLGKNFPLPTESALPYHGTSSSIIVPDGWIDGNGKYRGVGYKVSADTPMFQKGVNKINYASSMQSHLIGINWLYNDLHTAICGENTMQQAVDGAVVAKHTEPFLFFTQADGSDRAVFRGPCAFGAGKMDKPSWGYVKSAHADFCMIEGADNDKQLTDMRVPWDNVAHGNSPAKVFYDPEEEAYYYRIAGGDAEKCIDFDGGKTDSNGYPTSAIEGYIKAAWDFLYMHAPRIRHYNGTLSDFLTDAEYAMRSITAETTEEERGRIELARSRVNTANKYWCHAEGSSATGDYLLKRYDFADGEWVDAGLWDGSRYGKIDVRYGLLDAQNSYAGDSNDPYAGALSTAWSGLTAAQKNQSNVVNAAVVNAIVVHARANIGNYFKVSSLKFHYCFENHFIAGTDNCSKNTYYVLDPVTHLFELHQDDVDTTLATDNSGLQSKPYYIDRMHPYGGANASRVAMTADVDNDNILYEGYYNVLFDLVELMWEPTGDLQAMMNTILSQMASLTGGLGSAESGSMSGVWKALNRYIFDIQRYFPATVFNEAARIRYELPELIGFLSDIRSIHPIKQSMGDQLQAELQFMKRRLVYMASYAAFGEFTPTSLRSGLTGLAEATESFGMQKFALPGSSSPSAYTFKLVPHQWIYPTGGRETSNLIDPHVRVAPGETYTFDINPGQASDLGVNVFGLNYYRELGNIGDMVANNGQANFTLNGRRLTKFECEPTVFYTSDNLPAFRVNNIIIGTATRLKSFSAKGAVIGTGTLNLSALTLCESIDLRDTGISQVVLPQTSELETIELPSSIIAFSATAQPNLETLTFQGYGSLASLEIAGCSELARSSRAFAYGMMSSGIEVMQLDLDGINWTGNIAVGATFIRFMLGVGDRGSAKISGSIVLTSSTTNNENLLTYSDVKRLLSRYGDVRSSQNSLYISFGSFSINQNNVSIGGRKYIVPSLITMRGSDKWWLDFDGSGDAGIWEEISGGNNVDIARDGNGIPIQAADGTYYPALKWELIGEDNDSYASFPNQQLPELKLTNADGNGVTLNVRLSIKTISGDTLTFVKTIGLWNRVPEVGDYAWTDGQFDNENDPSKGLAGAVVMREEVKDNDNNVVAYKVWVVGDGTAVLPDSQNGDSASVPAVSGNDMKSAWGMYPDNTLGLPNTISNGAFADEIVEAISQAVQSWAKPQGVSLGIDTYFNLKTENGVFNTPLPDRAGGGYLRKTTADITASSERAMQDSTQSDGWKVHTMANEPYLANISETEDENAIMKSYADAVLSAAINYLGISNATYPTTLQQLADIMQQIVRYAGAKLQNCNPENVNLTQNSLARFRQLLFPAFRLAWCWSPADIAGNGVTEASLHEQYKRGKWMLPSSGLLARIFNFVGNSRSGYNSNTSIDESLHNEQVLEAQLPLYSNALHRGRGFNVSSGSNHWSSTEGNRSNGRYVSFSNGNATGSSKCYSFVVRPVTAFIFVP